MDEPSKFDLDETRRSISSESASKSASPDIPFVGKGPEAALRLWRDGWYGLAAGCIILGAWGLVGGWYFGLPLGGWHLYNPF